MEVPCSSRAYLPSLTFGLGSSDNVFNYTLDAFDYTTEIDHPHQGLGCALNISPPGAFGLPDDVIVLGAPFLRGVYGVFDFGDKQVGCKSIFLC